MGCLENIGGAPERSGDIRDRWALAFRSVATMPDVTASKKLNDTTDPPRPRRSKPMRFDLECDGRFPRDAGQRMRSAVHQRKLAHHPAGTVYREHRRSRRRREIHRQGPPHDNQAASRGLTLGVDKLAAREVVTLQRLEKFPQLRGPERFEEGKRPKHVLGDGRR
jgi:hypothetical protein